MLNYNHAKSEEKTGQIQIQLCYFTNWQNEIVHLDFGATKFQNARN